MERKLWNEPFDSQLIAEAMSLARGELVGIRGGRGAVVFVETGIAWITQDADRRDIVLEAGEWFRLDRDGTAVVQAQRAATITVTAPAGADAPEIYRPARGPRAGRGTWMRRLRAAWLQLHRQHPSQRPWDIRQPGFSAPLRDPLALGRPTR
jgi:hypothetical protein